MAGLYDPQGNEYIIDDSNKDKFNKDELMIDINNRLRLNQSRIMNLEKFHSEFNLPVLNLYGDTSGMTKDEAVLLQAVYTDGVRSFECIAETKWQGSTSIGFPKKNYNIKFVDGKGNKVKMSFKDWYDTHKYHMKANYYDYSMVRNVVGVQLGRKIYPYLYPNNARGVIDSFPFILYINDEWWGCYTWNLSQDEDLFGMDTTNPNHMCFRTDNNGWDIANFELRCPDDPTDYQQQCLSRMVSWTKSCTDDIFNSDVEKYFDLESLEYYWLMMDIGCAGDSMVNNATWATWDGEIWYVLWYDLDIIFGQNSGLYTPTTDLIAMSKTPTYSHKYNPIWERLYNTKHDDLCIKYGELRKKWFNSPETIVSYFTDYKDTWGEENIQKEYDKWPQRPNSGDDISKKIDWITQRLSYCDSKYSYVQS